MKTATPSDSGNTTGPGLQCRQVSFCRRTPRGTDAVVLETLSVRFKPGRVALVTGVTGAGKSTLLHLLAGVLRPSAGVILADGRPVSRWISRYRDQWRRKVGVVFQKDHLLENLTVLENVMLPLVPRNFTLTGLRHRATACLELLATDHLAALTPPMLSGGERQRVAVARAVVSSPRFLLADEPTAHQDPHGLDVIVYCLSKLKQKGVVVVLAGHDPRLQASSFLDDTYRLSGGQLTPQDPIRINGPVSR